MSRVDRSTLPAPGADRSFRFPTIATHRLDNGLVVRAVRHEGVPVASMTLLVPGGASVDPAGRHGLVSLTADLLDEGSAGQSALEVADRLARIGGDLDVDVGADAVAVSLTTLDRFLDEGLAFVHEIVSRPNLAEPDFARVRRLRIERLRQLRDHGPIVAERAFAGALYGAHPYGHLGLGTEASLESMALDDVRRLHGALFAPEGSTLVIAGPRDEAALLDAAARAFETWRRQASSMPVDREAAFTEAPAAGPRLAVVRRPGAAQSELRIGRVTTSRATPDFHALLMLNTILGGQFVSRVNLNLREHKGYTYGVRTSFDLRRGRGPFVLQTSVGTDVTAPAVSEALLELADVSGRRPATADELALALASVSKGYPRGFETAIQLARSVAQLALYGLPDTYFEDFIPRLSQVTVDEVTAAARRYLDVTAMTTVIVGDLERIGSSLGGLGLGEPVVLDVEF